jgi:hypothetical protein
MVYVPQNLNVFTAAYAGAISGMIIGMRNLNDTVSTDYTTRANVAGAFAESFDTQWGVAAANTLDVLAIEVACQGYWIGRFADPAQANFLLLGNYTTISNSIIAALQAGDAFFAGQGIIPAPWGTGPGAPPLQRVTFAQSPFAMTTGIEYIVDASGGSPLLMNAPVVPAGQAIIVKQDESTALGANIIRVVAGGGQSLANPITNPQTFTPTFDITGDQSKGLMLTWINASSGGGKLLVQ